MQFNKTGGRDSFRILWERIGRGPRSVKEAGAVERRKRLTKLSLTRWRGVGAIEEVRKRLAKTELGENTDCATAGLQGTLRKECCLEACRHRD